MVLGGDVFRGQLSRENGGNWQENICCPNPKSKKQLEHPALEEVSEEIQSEIQPLPTPLLTCGFAALVGGPELVDGQGGVEVEDRVQEEVQPRGPCGGPVDRWGTRV